MEGQYIIKNLVLISAGIVNGSTVKGAGIIAGPDARHLSKSIIQGFSLNRRQLILYHHL